MKNWQKTRNYRKYKTEVGSFIYTITVDGQNIEVDEDVYEAYATSERKLEYIERDLKRDRVLKDSTGKTIKDTNGQSIKLPEREISLDKLLADSWDFPLQELSPEDKTIKKLEFDELSKSIASLSAEEKELINALFYEEMTESEFASRIGITQKAVNKRKFKILAKLKKIL